jgi:FkbM family methyltransferase
LGETDGPLPADFEEIRLSGSPDQRFLIAASDEMIRSYVRERGGWEPGLGEFLASLVPARSRVVIGGGHVGLSAYQLWQARRDIAELVVFEPDAVNAGLLTLNVISWGPSPVRVMPMALGRRLGELLLQRNRKNTGDNRLWGEGDEPQHVVVVALDELWRGPLDLLLLDTQGWEPEVLAGAQRVIREERPAVVFEWWAHALTARGFDPDELLTWIERDLRLAVEVVPWAASGVHELLPTEARDIRDAREMTRVLLEQPPEWGLSVELVGRPAG